MRLQPSYRSEKLNSFLTKLDSRFEKQHSQQPRTQRSIGSPVSKPVPRHAKNWMVKKDFRNSTSAGQASQDAENEAEPEVEESNSEGDSVSGAEPENVDFDSSSDEY